MAQELARTTGRRLDNAMVCRPGLVVVGVLAVVGCADRGPNQDLIKLSGLRPKLVESGDTLQIHGAGFSEGTPARITFRGDIFRPGEVPRRDVEIVVRTKDTSKDTITFVVNDELEQAFCGVGFDASHAAFKGAVTVSFSAGSNSLAPVSGTIRGVELELLPRVWVPQAVRDRQRASEDALRFLGLELADGGSNECCTVASATGRASLAGIKPGDRLVQFDGVPVRAPTDLIPAGRNRTAKVWVRGENAAQPVVRSIDVQGFRWSIPSELAAAFGALMLASILVIGQTSFARKVFGSLCSRASQVLASSGIDTRSGRAQFTGFRHYLMDLPLPDAVALRIAQVFSVIILGAVCAAVSLREELVSGELDLLLWWVLSSVAISATVLSERLFRPGTRAGDSFLSAARALVHQFPLLIVIALASVATRSPRMVEIVRTQGWWVHSWLIFRDPGLALASLLAIASLVPVPENGGPRSSGSQKLFTVRDRRDSPARALLVFLSTRVHLWVQSLLLAVLLFGGWGASQEQLSDHAGRGAWALLPAAVLLVKTWTIIAALSLLRSMLPSLTHRHSTGWVLKGVLPLSILAGALSCLWTWGVRQWSLPWAAQALRWVTLSVFLALLLAAGVRIVRRLRSGIRAPLENYWT